MKKDNQEEAAKIARVLLNSVGLSSTPSLSSPQAQTAEQPVRRRANVSVEFAFARLPRVDRTESAQRTSRAAHLTGTTVEELRSKLADSLSQQYGVPAINLPAFNVRAEVLALVPKAVATAFGVVPVNVVGDLLIVATHDPSNEYLLSAVAQFTGFPVEAVVAALPDIDDAITRLYVHEGC